MKLKGKQIDNKTLESVKKANSMNGTVEASKNLAKKLKEQDQKSKKSNTMKSPAKPKKTEKPEKTKTKRKNGLTRKIVPVDKQTDYEKRSYRRDFHNEEALNVVVNGTSHTADEAQKQCYEFMMNTFKATGDKTFTTTELVTAIKTFGSSYGDVVREGMQKLAKEGKVQISLDKTSKRRRYKYTLVTT